MSTYPRSRLAIGTFRDTEALGRCLSLLAQASDIVGPVFVVALTDTSRDEWQRRSGHGNSSVNGTMIEFVTLDGAVPLSDGDTHRALVAGFERWMDVKSAAFLRECAAGGAVLLFVPVENAQQQASVFQALRGNTDGRVVLHDTPAAWH